MQLRYLLLLCLTAILPLGAAKAQLTAPSNGGEVSIVRVTATSMELEFGTLGTGQGRVVAMASTPNGMPVPLVAADNQFYTGSAIFGRGTTLGSGYVVYSGSGNTITVTGLQPNTYYYLTNAEYNTAGSSIVYNTRCSSVSTATSRALSIPLPVELTSFNGTVNAYGKAVLNWATATERNSAYFALERSTDGITFAEANRVPAAGTSTRSLTYQWADPKALTQRTYYRLRQADIDGTLTFSSVVALAPNADLARMVEVYPNPSAGQPVQLLLQSFNDQSLTLRLVDAVGHLVLTHTLTPTATLFVSPLPLPTGLPAGTYILNLTGAGSSPIQKRITLSN